MKDVDFFSQNTKNLLRGRYEWIEEINEKPIVIFLTGDSPKGASGISWKIFPELLNNAGFGSFLFDFEGLGQSEGQRKDLTLSRAIDNFQSALTFLLNNGWERKNLFALGTSLGGTVLINSVNETNMLTAIGLRSPASFLPDAYFNEISRETFEQWRVEGYSEANGYDYKVVEDALTYNSFFNARNIGVPTLITHGENDEIVPYQHSLYLHSCLRCEKELILFENVGHSYSGDDWYRNANKFIDWFSKQNIKVGN